MSSQNDPRESLKNAFQLIQSGQKLQASKIIGEVLKADPNNADGWYLAALVTEGLDKKARMLERALENDPHRWLKVGADPEKDVEAVLKLSAAQLVRDSVERGTRWHLLHIFDGDFDLTAAAAAWNADENDLGVLNDLSDMENRSLIIFDRNTRRYHLHDLLRPIAEGLFG